MSMFLVKNNVPFDVAFSLGPAEKIAYCVAMGEIEGNSFDWETMSWRKK